MTSIERERLAVLTKKAADIQKIWLREREEKRTTQVTANAEIRRLWAESDLLRSNTEQPNSTV